MFRSTVSTVRTTFLRVALPCAFAAATPLPAAHASVENNDAHQLLARLETVNPDWLFDMHGNADDALQRLMVLRFDATAAVTARIDALAERGDDPAAAKLRRALYGVLGTVKDPAAIRWLQQKLAAGQHEILVHEWLVEWQDLYPAYGEWPWLTGRKDWIKFLLAGLQQDPDPTHAVEWLHVLSGFNDPEVVERFEARRRDSTDPCERLLVEAYLAERGRPPRQAAIESALTALATQPQHDQWVVLMAVRLRHQAFIPFLIERMERPGSEHQVFAPSLALEKISYRSDIADAAGWRRWHAEHAQEQRQSWRLQQQANMSELLRNDENAAVAFFDKAVYAWDDIEFLPYVQAELLPRPAFGNDIAGWINLTYRPAYRARLEPIARKLVASDTLDDWAQRLLTGRGFIAREPAPTWEEEVRMRNSRV